MNDEVAPDPVVVGLKRAIAFLIGAPAILVGFVLLVGGLLFAVQVLLEGDVPLEIRLPLLGMLGASLWGPVALLLGGSHLVLGTPGSLAVTLIGWVLTIAAFVAWTLSLAGLVVYV